MAEIFTIVPKLQEREDYARRIELKLAMLDILIEAVRAMRGLGASPDDITRTLHRPLVEIESDRA
jgi:hypothetical protein